MSALAVGSMVPDAPLFLGGVVPGFPVGAAYAHTHGWVGLVSTNLVVGLIVWALWEFVLRAALFEGLPTWLRSRATALTASVARSRRGLVVVPLGVLIGAATHVGLDEFTHRGRWAATHLVWFRETHAGLLGTSWVQYGAGALGLTILSVILVRGVWGANPQHCPSIAPRLAALVWQVPLAVGGLSIAVSVAAWMSGRPLAQVAYGAATTGGATLVLAALVSAIIWHALVRWGPGLGLTRQTTPTLGQNEEITNGGGWGIRTPEGLHPTRFPSERHRPLGESSVEEDTWLESETPKTR